MFTDISIERGFTKVNFDMKTPFAGETYVVRSTVMAMTQTHIEIAMQEPETFDSIMGLGLVMNPAVIYTLSMSRISTVLDVEHEAYKNLSRELPITLKLHDNPMLIVHPKQNAQGQWGATIDVLSHGVQSSVVEWEPDDWSWGQMISLALTLPAMFMLKMMELIEEYKVAMRESEAQMTISNELMAKEMPPETTTIRAYGFGDPDDTMPSDPNSPIPTITASDEDFDAAFKRLVAETKKEGLDA